MVSLKKLGVLYVYGGHSLENNYCPKGIYKIDLNYKNKQQKICNIDGRYKHFMEIFENNKSIFIMYG